MATTSLLETVCERVANNDPTLSNVYLYGQDIGDDGAKAVATALVHNTRVECLYMQRNNIGYEGARELAAKLEFNSTVTTVNLGGNRIGDEGARAFARMLFYGSAVEELILWDNGIGDVGLGFLMDGLERGRSALKLLNLSRNEIGDVGTCAVRDYLLSSRRKSLVVLHLNRNNITSDGIANLAEGLANDTSLETLCLEGNQICNVGIKNLGLALRTNQGLRSLYLNGNPIFSSRPNRSCGVRQLVQRGLAQNFYLQNLCVSYYRHMDSSLTNEMDFYLKLNKSGRQLLRHVNAPASLWANVVSNAGKHGDPSLVNYLLRENPSLFATARIN